MNAYKKMNLRIERVLDLKPLDFRRKLLSIYLEDIRKFSKITKRSLHCKYVPSERTSDTVKVLTQFAGGSLDIVRTCIQDLKYIEIPEENESSDIVWSGSSNLPPIKLDHRSINKFPDSAYILSKVSLFRSLELCRNLLPDIYEFYPQTWFLPFQQQAFNLEDINSNKKTTYIVKPDYGTQGKGIYLIQSTSSYDPQSIIHTRLKQSQKLTNQINQQQQRKHIEQDSNSCSSYLFSTITHANSNLDKLNQPQNLNKLQAAVDVVQLYEQCPILLNGHKTDIRIYVLIESIYPLKIYIYRDGLVRLASKLYEKPNQRNLHMRKMHLTNYSINKLSGSPIQMDDNLSNPNKHDKLFDVQDKSQNVNTKSYKCSLRELLNMNKSVKNEFNNNFNEQWKKIDPDKFWSQVDQIVCRTIFALCPQFKIAYWAHFGYLEEKHLNSTINEPDLKLFRPNCFQILGFDFLLIEPDFRLILLEVNSNPSLRTDKMYSFLDYLNKQDKLPIFSSSNESFDLKNRLPKRLSRALTPCGPIAEIATLLSSILGDRYAQFEHSQVDQLIKGGLLKSILKLIGNNVKNLNSSLEENKLNYSDQNENISLWTELPYLNVRKEGNFYQISNDLNYNSNRNNNIKSFSSISSSSSSSSSSSLSICEKSVNYIKLPDCNHQSVNNNHVPYNNNNNNKTNLTISKQTELVNKSKFSINIQQQLPSKKIHDQNSNALFGKKKTNQYTNVDCLFSKPRSISPAKFQQLVSINSQITNLINHHQRDSLYKTLLKIRYRKNLQIQQHHRLLVQENEQQSRHRLCQQQKQVEQKCKSEVLNDHLITADNNNNNIKKKKFRIKTENSTHNNVDSPKISNPTPNSDDHQFAENGIIKNENLNNENIIDDTKTDSTIPIKKNLDRNDISSDLLECIYNEGLLDNSSIIYFNWVKQNQQLIQSIQTHLNRIKSIINVSITNIDNPMRILDLLSDLFIINLLYKRKRLLMTKNDLNYSSLTNSNTNVPSLNELEPLPRMASVRMDLNAFRAFCRHCRIDKLGLHITELDLIFTKQHDWWGRVYESELNKNRPSLLKGICFPAFVDLCVQLADYLFSNHNQISNGNSTKSCPQRLPIIPLFPAPMYALKNSGNLKNFQTRVNLSPSECKKINTDENLMSTSHTTGVVNSSCSINTNVIKTLPELNVDTDSDANSLVNLYKFINHCLTNFTVKQ